VSLGLTIAAYICKVPENGCLHMHASVYPVSSVSLIFDKAPALALVSRLDISPISRKNMSAHLRMQLPPAVSGVGQCDLPCKDVVRAAKAAYNRFWQRKLILRRRGGVVAFAALLLRTQEYTLFAEATNQTNTPSPTVPMPTRVPP
jgi:hypothetical protein